MPVVVLLALLFATQLSRPIVHLRDQVRQIATGQYTARVSTSRGDEIGQLADALNDLASQLDRFDHETRQNERLRVLNQLGSGIAHQMRNAVTGALMAADVHERTGDEESLTIVRRQLRLLESNVQRFLTLSQPAPREHEQLVLKAVVTEAINLVRPAFKHVHVELNLAESEDGETVVLGNRDALHDVLTNLLLNALEAASSGPNGARSVDVSIDTLSDDPTIAVCVSDSGPGPPPDMADTLYEPFVTSKPEGTGLGLFVVERAMRDHDGRIRWQRNGDRTEFVLEFPIHSA